MMNQLNLAFRAELAIAALAQRIRRLFSRKVKRRNTGRIFEVRGGWGGTFHATEEETRAYCKQAGFDEEDFLRTCIAEGMIREVTDAMFYDAVIAKH